MWILGIAVILVVLRVVLPAAADWAIEREGSKAVGRWVEVKNVDFSLHEGGIALDDVRIGPPTGRATRPEGLDPRGVVLGVRRVAARIDWIDLFKRTVHLRELSIAGAAYHFERRPDGTLVPLRISFPGARSQREPAGKPGDKGSWPILVDRFVLRDGGLHLVDLPDTVTRPVQFHLDEFSLADFSLRDGQIALRKIDLNGPRLRVDHAFALRRGATQKPAPREAAAAPPGYRASEIAVERAAFTLITDTGKLDVAMSFSAREISGESGRMFPMRLALEIEGGRIDAEGTLGITPPAYTGRVKWSALPFPPLLKAAAAELPYAIASASSDGDLQVTARFAGDAKGAPTTVALRGTTAVRGLDIAEKGGLRKARASAVETTLDDSLITLAPEGGIAPSTVRGRGRLVLTDLDLEDRPDALTMRVPALEAVAEEVALDLAPEKAPIQPPRVTLAKLDIRAPQVAYTLLKAAPAKEGRKASRAGAAEEAPPRILLRQFTLDDGAIDVTDRTLSPEARSRIRALRVTASGVRWPENDAERLAVTGRGPAGGAFDVHGSLRGGNGPVGFTINQLALPPFNPYAERDAGYTVDRGSATVKTALRLLPDRIEAKNDVLIEKIAVSKAAGETVVTGFGVPLDLAVALLTDLSGNIRLPVSFTLKRGAVRTQLRPIVLAAMKAAVLGLMTSPLKLMGGAFRMAKGIRGGGIGIDPLGARPGSPDLEPPQAARLASIAQTLEQRPALAVRLGGRAGPKDDPALAERILIEQVGLGGDLPKVEDAGFLTRRRIRGALKDRAKGDPGLLEGDDEKAFRRMVAATPVPAERRAALARARAEGVKTALVRDHGLDPDRIALGPVEEGPPQVEIDLGTFARRPSPAVPPG